MHKTIVLADDIDIIQHALTQFSGYDFARDVAARMQAMGLTQSALAVRAHVSHAAVGKWLGKGARPHGKERYKELGMALGMDEPQLDRFLQVNGYPRLYAKNPLDAACRFVVSTTAGNERIVSLYRDFLKLYKLDKYMMDSDPAGIDTTLLSRAFNQVRSAGGFEGWLKAHEKHFRAFDKSYIPHEELVRFVLLYIGDQSINDIYITGEIPVTIKNLLYPLIADREIAIRGLRTKLIVFGVYENMNEDEIDIMLRIAKLHPLSAPSSRVDFCVLTALRCAHDRYPYYECRNAEKVLRHLDSCDMPELCGFYREQQDRAAQFVAYYEADGHKSELDRLFEERYTDYAGLGIVAYLRDIFALLTENGALTESETGEYAALMQTY